MSGLKIFWGPSVRPIPDGHIAEQAAFVVWWDAGLGGRESLGSNQYRSVPGRGPTAREAFEQTGISKQMVSRWRKSLEDRAQYSQ